MVTKNPALKIPGLLLRSVLGRINRREQERQRQKNLPSHFKQEFLEWIEGRGAVENAGTKEIPRDWDVRWMPVPSVDVVLSSGSNLDGSRWSADWPNKASTYYYTFPQPAASGAVAVGRSSPSAASAAKAAPPVSNARAVAAQGPETAPAADTGAVSLPQPGPAAAAALGAPMEPLLRHPDDRTEARA